MRPPHSWLLTVVASLWMTSSTVMGGAPLLSVVNGCPGDTEGCVIANSKVNGANKEITCNEGFVLEQDVLEPATNLLKPSPKLKAACYPKCHSKYRTVECPSGMQSPECELALFTPPNQLSCKAGYSLIANGVTVASPPLTCDVLTGWSDASSSNVIVDFTTGHHLVAFCQHNPPPPGPACNPPSFENESPGSLAKAKIDPPNSLTLKCPTGSKLIHGSKLYDRAECDKTSGKWKGFVTAAANPSVDILDLNTNPVPKLRVKCLSYCIGRFDDACTASDCIPPKLTGDTLECAAAVLQVDGSFYNDAKCSDAGWKSGTKLLVDYTKNPLANLRVECKPYASMFEDDCPKGVCEAPKFKSPDLVCEKANYLLVVNKPDGSEIVAQSARSTDAGWEVPANPPSPVIPLVVYSQKAEKLKARCFSRCHTRFVDRTCTPPCSEPIYMNEGQPLFCRNADEELFLNDVKVPDVVCDVAAGGWRGAGQPTDPLLVDFASITSDDKIVKAVCKKTTTPIPVPPVINGTERNANKAAGLNSQIAMYVLGSIIAVLVLVVGGLGMFLWRIHKKKSDDDDEGHSKTKTKSKGSNSSKNKKEKKGKKNSKKTSKKGKKGKKGKKDKEMEIDSDVEVPEHQMSEANSTMPLTAAVVKAGESKESKESHKNPNVMDV